MSTGINKICSTCSQSCEQFGFAEVVNCPKYKPADGYVISKDGVIRARKS